MPADSASPWAPYKTQFATAVEENDLWLLSEALEPKLPERR